MSNEVMGSVASLWRYPVKSMMGEEPDASDVSERGPVGDWAYALADRETGKLASAKHPRKWGRLFDFGAVFVEPPRIGYPAPAVLARRLVDDLLGHCLGRPSGGHTRTAFVDSSLSTGEHAVVSGLVA